MRHTPFYLGVSLCLLLVTSGRTLAADDGSPLPDPSEEVVAFAKFELRHPNAEVKRQLIAVQKFCGKECEETRVSVTLVSGQNGKTGDSQRSYLVTVTYLSTAGSAEATGHYRALPLLIKRVTTAGHPNYELAGVLPFGSLETKLQP